MSAVWTDSAKVVGRLMNRAAKGTHVGEAYVFAVQMASATSAVMRVNPVAMGIIAMSGISVGLMGCATVVAGQMKPAVKAIFAGNGRSAEPIICAKAVEVVKNCVARGAFVISTTDAA